MPKKTIPEFEPPMMANGVKEPFDSPDWIFEIKLDGYRALAPWPSSGIARGACARLLVRWYNKPAHSARCGSGFLDAELR
jgi:hypothetical protein